MLAWLSRSVLPVATIVAAIIVIWYAAAIPMNSMRTYMMAPDDAEISFSELVSDTWSQQKPQLPLPHQIVREVKKQATFSWIWKEKRRGYKRSLIYHTWVTLSSTLLGFGLGLVLGVSLSLAIVYSRVMDLSVMPWVITSQTIPIIAIAPMIIVIMAPMGLTGLMPKGVISMYLSYFPIVIGMTKGLRSSDPILEDQMKTWSATAFQTFLLLRLPSALPYLFPAMKISLAAALVGAVVAELPSGARAGLGARLLVFSYRSETIPMWANLVSAAILAGLLVVSFGMLERALNRRLGFRTAGEVSS